MDESDELASNNYVEVTIETKRGHKTTINFSPSGWVQGGPKVLDPRVIDKIQHVLIEEDVLKP